MPIPNSERNPLPYHHRIGCVLHYKEYNNNCSRLRKASFALKNTHYTLYYTSIDMYHLHSVKERKKN